MIRCYFLGHGYIYDEDLDKKLSAELEKMVQLDEKIELWFYEPDSFSYEGLCLLLSIWLRTKYPHKSIKIARFFLSDVRGTLGKETIEYDNSVDYHFPRALVDKNLYLPYDGWLAGLCDYLFFYNYPDLDQTIADSLHYIKKGTTIIHLASEKTEALIQETKTLLNEQEQHILKLLKEGKTPVSVAQTLSMPRNAIRLKIKDANRNLQQLVKKAASTERQYPKGVCALMGLGNPLANSPQLTLFGYMLDYLIRHGVSEFWLDEDSLRTSYGVILIRAVDYKKQTTYAREEFTLKIFPSTLQGYKEAIKQSKWVLTDYTHSQAETIKTLCSEDGRTLLVDIGSDRRKIEKTSF